MANQFKDPKFIFICLLVVICLVVYSIKTKPETVNQTREAISRNIPAPKNVHVPKYTSRDGSGKSFSNQNSQPKEDSDASVTRQGDGNSFHGHVQLQWLRQVITEKYGLKLPSDMYDMTSLYKLKTHIFFDAPLFHKPRYYPDTPGKVQYDEGQNILKYIKYEALLTGHKRRYLPEVHNADGFGRTCDYDPHKEYTFKFSAFPNGNKVHIFVTETPMNKTKSGNNFSNYVFGIVNAESTKVACNTTDYFHNQTYQIVCPIVESNFKIAIDATYLSLAALEFVCKTNFVWHLKEYTSQELNQNKNLISGVKGIENTKKVKCTNNNGHEHGFWVKVNNVFHWGTPECYYPYVITKSQEQCLAKMTVINFGDSHTQNRVGAIKVTFKPPNFIHYKTRHTVFLLDTLLDVYELYKKGQRPADVLVLNAGNHDLRYLDEITYIATMSEIFQVFKYLSQLEKPPRIIWVETTPIHFNGFHGRFMTRQVTEAMNDWIDHNMKLLGVDVVHAFEIAQTMTSQHRGYGCHFYHFLGSSVKPNRQISVGGAIAMVLLQTICPAGSQK